jgi:hypothetical protein
MGRLRRSAVGLALTAVLAPAGAAQAQSTPELSVTDRLEDRRYTVNGDRSYAVGFEHGRYPAQGWHVRGEMGGFWAPPIKMLDGLWVGIDGEWAGPAERFTSGWGYVRHDHAPVGDVRIARTEFAPDGRRAVLVGLRLQNTRAEARTVTVNVDAHSELMSTYPWGWSQPVSAKEFNLQDTAAYEDGALVFREQGTPPGPNTTEHDWAAVVAATADPSGGDAGDGPHRGPQGDVICTNDATWVDPCDDSEFGKGAGGQLRYRVDLPASGSADLWIAVAGSDAGAGQAREEAEAVLADPAALLAAKTAERRRQAGFTKLSLPGDPRLAAGIDWSKQNLLDSIQAVDDMQIRDVDEGRKYDAPLGTLERARWLGAGWPDYPWLFGTDGEYTAFASVGVGQFEPIMDHLRALRDISLLANGDSGKVVHEVTHDGSIYYGLNDDPGNTDETAKFPSAVALLWRWTGDGDWLDEMYDFSRANMEHVVSLDEDGDGWPEGLGNVERGGMGEEKLDNAVYTIRGLYDLADMAQAQGDDETRTWALDHGRELRQRFEREWWMPEVPQHADSLREPGGQKSQQRHWIGGTPMDVELVERRRTEPGLTTYGHGTAALALRETECYSNENGMFHTGRAGCDGAPEGDRPQGELDIFTLNTAIMAVGQGNYGRMEQQARYTEDNVALQLDSDEQPGAMPERASAPAYGTNIDKPFTERGMVLQAWGAYGTIWPVVHQQLGVRPDLGRGWLEVVPQLPGPQPIAGRDIRLGEGLVDVSASRTGTAYSTTVDTGNAPVRRLRIGHTLPRDARVASVRLGGRAVRYETRLTNRGLEVTAATRPGRRTLTVRTRR